MSADAPWWWATPFFSGALGVVAAYIGIRFDLKKSINQEVIKKRLAIFDKTAPLLNDIFCFQMCIGRWRSLSPTQMLENKRALDSEMHVYEALFSGRFVDKYSQFMNSCFVIYRGIGRTAALRADTKHMRTNWQGNWNDAWDDLSDEDNSVGVSRR
jgi:hypothetical protein